MQGGGLEGSGRWGVGLIFLQRERGEKQSLFCDLKKRIRNFAGNLRKVWDGRDISLKKKKKRGRKFLKVEARVIFLS
jgi:hypothetical protein